MLSQPCRLDKIFLEVSPRDLEWFENCLVAPKIVYGSDNREDTRKSLEPKRPGVSISKSLLLNTRDVVGMPHMNTVGGEHKLDAVRSNSAASHARQ